MNNEGKKLSEFYSRSITDKFSMFEDLTLKLIKKETELTSEPSFLLEGYDTYGDNEQNLHLSQVVVNMGGKIYLINETGLHELEGNPTNRGVSIFRQYFNEEGEVFETQEQFHKGSILKETKKIGKVRYLKTKDELKTTPIKNTPNEAINTNDIWRD
jgi:hypothetical protein